MKICPKCSAPNSDEAVECMNCNLDLSNSSGENNIQSINGEKENVNTPTKYVDYDNSDVIDVEYEAMPMDDDLVDIAQFLDEEDFDKFAADEVAQQEIDNQNPAKVSNVEEKKIVKDEEGAGDNIPVYEKYIDNGPSIFHRFKDGISNISRFKVLITPYRAIMIILVIISIFFVYFIFDESNGVLNYNKDYIVAMDDGLDKSIEKIIELNEGIMEEYNAYFNGDKSIEEIYPLCKEYLNNGEKEIDNIEKYKDINSKEYIFYIEKSYYSVAVVADFLMKYMDTSDDTYLYMAKDDFALIKDYSDNIKEEHKKYLKNIK